MRTHISTHAVKIRIKADTPVAGRHKMGWVVSRLGGQPGIRYWNDRTWPQLAKATHTNAPCHPPGIRLLPCNARMRTLYPPYFIVAPIWTLKVYLLRPSDTPPPKLGGTFFEFCVNKRFSRQRIEFARYSSP